ncbi:MAG: PAS domain S-box protein [Candidatus Omnitrophica bacterium]|nr:PAS domain S-box protein [Candidatus Omnitrophota bacterium]
MEKILIVEDGKDAQFLLSNILKDAGYQTIVAGDGDKALKELERHSPNLALLDIKLPDMNGTKLLEDMRKNDKHLTIIMLSAYSDVKDAVKAMKLGAFDYITKPFDNDELLLVIKKALKMDEPKILNNDIKTDINNVAGREREEDALQLACNELEQRVAERTEALRKSEENYRELTSSIADVFFAMSKDLRYTYWNKASENLTGISAKDALGKSLYELFPDIRGTETEKLYLKALETQQPQSALNEYRVKDKNFFFEISAYPSNNGLSVFVKDITERKKVDEALQEREKRYRAILQTTIDGFWLVSPQGRLLEVNEAYCRMSGYSAQELLAMSVTDLDALETSDETAAHIQKVMTQGEDRFESRHRRKDGSIFDVEISAQHRSPYGWRFVAFLRDITKRKRSEEESRVKDAAIASSINAIAIFDPDGNLTYINDSFLKLWGYDNEEDVIGKSYSMFWEDQAQAHVVAGALRQSGQWAGELNAKKKDGSIIIVQLAGSIVLDSAGIFEGMMASFIDITDRKRAEEAIAAAKDYIENIIKSMLDTLIVINPDGKIRSINEATTVLLGYEEEELIGKPFGTIVAAAEERIFKDGHLEKLIGEGSARDYELSYKAKDGRVVPMLLSGAIMRKVECPGNAPSADCPEFKKKGTHCEKLQGIVLVAKDITERKKAEEEIISLSKFPAENPNPVLRIAEDGTILYSNRAASELLAAWGAKIGEKAPKRWCRLIKEKLDSEKTGLEEEEEEGKMFSITIAPIKKAGYVNLYASDITERKQVESQRDEALRESERKLRELVDKTTHSQKELKASYTELKASKDDLVRSEKLAYTGRIAASIAHEIRNPLTNVSMSVRQLKKGDRIKPEGHKHSEIIERNVERINFLITELLNCARPAKLDPKSYDIHRVIKDALIADKSKIRSQRVKVIKILSAKPSILNIDREHMGRVLLNLITNAVDAMPGGGNLTISTEINKDFFLIKVEDSGKGIPEKDIIRIFDPFFSTKAQGVGLGLTTCYGIIVSHGGTIEVESKWRKGTAFIISLPVGARAGGGG